jgi:hypothetical protein
MSSGRIRLKLSGMSINNDYTVAFVAKQQRKELLARAAEDRLARLVPGRSAPWWRRLFILGRRVQTSQPAADVPVAKLITKVARPTTI